MPGPIIQMAGLTLPSICALLSPNLHDWVDAGQMGTNRLVQPSAWRGGTRCSWDLHSDS